MDIFKKKAKVKAEQKTYDKNSMLMHKSKDIRANANADADGNTIAHEVANSNANSVFFVNSSYIMTDSSYNSRPLNFYDF